MQKTFYLKMPGRILRSRQTEWINDGSTQSENYFLRNQIAKAFNLKASFGFPIFDAPVIVGIFVFFIDQVCEEDSALVQQAIASATPNASFWSRIHPTVQIVTKSQAIKGDRAILRNRGSVHNHDQFQHYDKNPGF